MTQNTNQEQQPDNKQAGQQGKQRPPHATVQITDVLKTALRNWFWVLVSVVVCMTAAYFYVHKTPPVFSRSASILIRDDNPGESINAKDQFQQLGLLSSYRSIYDEIEVIGSRDIMAEVVAKHKLDISYTNLHGLMKNSLYGANLPVEVIFNGLKPDDSFSFHMKVNDKGEISLSNAKLNLEKVDIPGKTTFNAPVRIPGGGTFTIVKSPAWKADKPSVYIAVSKGNWDDVVNTYNNRLKVSNKDDKSSVLDLTFTDQSIQRADDVLNGVIEAYNNSWVRARNQITDATDSFINERLAVIQKELGQVDSDISQYKSKNMVPDVTATSQIFLTEGATNDQQLFDISNQLQLTKYLKEYLLRETNKYTVLPAYSGISNPSLEKQIDDYNTLIISRQSYLNNYSENHPVLQDLEVRIKALRSALISSIDNQLKTLNTTFSNLERKEALNNSRIANAPTQAKVLLSAERQQLVKEQLYLFLLQKREENQLTRNSIAPNNRVITSVHGPRIPITVSGLKVYAMAFLAGLAIPLVIIFLQQTINTRIRSRKELENLTVPVVGEIPEHSTETNPLRRFIRTLTPKRFNHSPKMELGMLVEEGNRDVINEAFRVLRTNLSFMSGNTGGHQVIMVSSFNPGSGKTFITLNLAMALTLKGKKVLVIDGDLRRCSLSANVGSPKAGLTDYLMGKSSSLRALIQPIKNGSGLEILPVGYLPPNPTELLESAGFREMIESLRKDYDYIFIDCPPSEMMADAKIINEVCDRTLFIVRIGLLDRGMLPVLQKMYDDHKYKNMCVIVNGTTAADFGYSHGYAKYGYGNYGYSYSK